MTLVTFPKVNNVPVAGVVVLVFNVVPSENGEDVAVVALVAPKERFNGVFDVVLLPIVKPREIINTITHTCVFLCECEYLNIYYKHFLLHI